MSDDLINRLRDIQGQAGLFASAAAERIEELEAKSREAFQLYVDANEARIDAEAKLAKAKDFANYLTVKHMSAIAELTGG